MGRRRGNACMSLGLHRFNNGAQYTLVEWDWVNGPVMVTNIWNAVIDASYTTTTRIRVKTQWQNAAFGFQGTGTFGVGNLKVCKLRPMRTHACVYRV